MDDLTRIQPVKRTSLALRCERTGKLHELIGEMLVGREVECDIQLESSKISRYHAKLYVSANGLYVEHLGSSNGTYLNRQKVRQRTHIGLGDQISFDTLSYRVTTSRSGNADDTQLVTPPEIASATAAKEANERSPQLMRSALGRTQKQVLNTANPYQQPPGSVPDTYGGNAKNTPSADLQDFLEFAASGLKAQEPISREDANPFGMGASSPAHKEANSNKDLEANKGAAQASLWDQFSEPGLRPKVNSRSASSSEATSSIERVNDSWKMADNPVEEEDADKTMHVSLNDMDQYAFMNKKHQQDLDVGSGPRVIAMTAPIRGKVFQLSSDEDVTCWSIGRDDGADVCIRDPGVSREHAWITKLETLYQLRISNMASEIIVNGQAQSEVDLKDGDRLQFGAMELVFRLNANESDGCLAPGVASEEIWWCKVKAFFKRIVKL